MTSSDWSRLAPELLVKIARELSVKDRCTARLVCRAWSEPFVPSEQFYGYSIAGKLFNPKGVQRSVEYFSTVGSYLRNLSIEPMYAIPNKLKLKAAKRLLDRLFGSISKAGPALRCVKLEGWRYTKEYEGLGTRRELINKFVALLEQQRTTLKIVDVRKSFESLSEFSRCLQALSMEEDSSVSVGLSRGRKKRRITKKYAVNDVLEKLNMPQKLESDEVISPACAQLFGR